MLCISYVNRDIENARITLIDRVQSIFFEGEGLN